jgi:hypothetical protein
MENNNYSSDFSESDDEDILLNDGDTVLNTTNVDTVADTTVTINDATEVINIPEYDPILYERIICVELINNDKIFVNYDITWTIGDVRI